MKGLLKIRSFKLSQNDVHNLDSICTAEQVHSRSEMIRRMISERYREIYGPKKETDTTA